jgi:hypothetical protein
MKKICLMLCVVILSLASNGSVFGQSSNNTILLPPDPGLADPETFRQFESAAPVQSDEVEHSSTQEAANTKLKKAHGKKGTIRILSSKAKKEQAPATRPYVQTSHLAGHQARLH